MKLKALFSLSTVLLLVLSACASSGGGGGHGYVMTIPQVVPEEDLFQVNIQRVNGKQPIDARQYSVPAGEATIRVSLVLDPQWSRGMSAARTQVDHKEITLTVVDGVTYQLGGKVDTKASLESQRNNTYWEPVIHREIK